MFGWSGAWGRWGVKAPILWMDLAAEASAGPRMAAVTSSLHFASSSGQPVCLMEVTDARLSEHQGPANARVQSSPLLPPIPLRWVG